MIPGETVIWVVPSGYLGACSAEYGAIMGQGHKSNNPPDGAFSLWSHLFRVTLWATCMAIMSATMTQKQEFFPQKHSIFWKPQSLLYKSLEPGTSFRCLHKHNKTVTVYRQPELRLRTKTFVLAEFLEIPSKYGQFLALN